MEAEAIAIASLSTFRHGVVVVVGIAVEPQVIVASSADALALSVLGLGDLHTHYVEAFQVEKAAFQPKTLTRRSFGLMSEKSNTGRSLSPG